MLSLHSPVFHDHGRLPARYTCEGSEVSPPLRWTGVPEQTVSAALILEDADRGERAPGRPVTVLWVVYNLPPTIGHLPEGVEVSALEPWAGEGLNDRHGVGYLPPCPDQGPHRFVFRLFALDAVLEGLHVPNRFHLEAAMHGHVLEVAELTALFQRSD